jgi:hypothetical protein
MPPRCPAGGFSGGVDRRERRSLDVVRYTPDVVRAELGAGFHLLVTEA